jgi:hypothetical protein
LLSISAKFCLGGLQANAASVLPLCRPIEPLMQYQELGVSIDNRRKPKEKIPIPMKYMRTWNERPQGS